MKKLLAAVLLLGLLVSLLPTVQAASGVLSITVPSDVTVKLYTGFAATGSVITVNSRSTQGSMRTYTFEDLSTGTYSYRLSGTNYYTHTKNLYYESGSYVSIDANPEKKTGAGFESSTAVYYTDEVMSNLLPSTKYTWKGYESIFTTPAFTDSTMGANEFTGQTEMLAYLQALLPECGNMYYFHLGTSPSKRYTIPLVIFTRTDLTGKSIEDAAALLRANDKPTLLHQAQVHGNEPAAGEGALALCGRLARGELLDNRGNDILNSVNVMVIPRINVDGSYAFTRANVAEKMNMNRDYLRVQSVEIEAILKAYNLFLPEVVIDAHEWTPSNSTESGVLDDMQLWASGSLNNDTSLLHTSVAMMETVFDAARGQSLRPYYYQGVVNFGEGNNSIGPYYYGLRGSFGFCVETPGIGIGKANFERRVFTQYLTAETLLRYTAENADALRAACEAERERIAQIGASYESSDLLVLKHSSKSFGKSYLRPKWNLSTGVATSANATATPTIYNVASQTRSRPTAYILSANTKNLNTVLQTFAKHDVLVTELTQSVSVPVRQYSGTGSSASLSLSKYVTFPAGSYVIPMNQAGGNVIAMLMEPDVSDTASPTEAYSTFVQTGTLDAESIYRYEGDLSVFRKRCTLTFCHEDGSVLQTQEIPLGNAGTYSGQTPEKAYDADFHYAFSAWTTANGSPADLSKINGDTVVYAAFTAQAHEYVRSESLAPTCINEGKAMYSCTCGSSYEETLPATGHSPETISGKPATCIASGISDGQKCSVCGEITVAQTNIPRLGHEYKYSDNGNGTHSGECIRCDKTLAAEVHGYEDGICTACGAGGTTEPIYDGELKFSHSLTLENDISINFIGQGSALSAYDTFYLECKVPVYNGNELVRYEIVNIDPVFNGTNYEFTLTGITAKMMNNEIEAVFRLTKDGQEYYSKTDVYSVAEYAYGKLDSTKAADTAELKAICANLLRYGAMAQTQFNYRTDALVDAEMTDAHKAYLTDLNTVEMKDYRKQLADHDAPTVPWKSTTLELGNKVIMCLIANLANYTGNPSELTMRLTFTDNNGAVITEERPLELYNPDAKPYAVSYDRLRATEMRSVVSAAIYHGETRVSKTVEYSIESYGARSSDVAMQELCLAMLAYGDSANIYFAK